MKLGYLVYKSDVNRYLKKVEEMDISLSGFIKCRYARNLSYDVI